MLSLGFEHASVKVQLIVEFRYSFLHFLYSLIILLVLTLVFFNFFEMSFGILLLNAPIDPHNQFLEDVDKLVHPSVEQSVLC